MAGESARDVAAKRREKARRLNKVADAYERGAAGEVRTAQALAMLPTAGWFVLHDVRWPGKRFANIDHVVIGPGGVFVIDSKAWSGRVEVRDDVLRQNGYKRESAVAAAADAAMAVAEQVPGLDPYAAKPVLCFVGDHHLEGWARDVMLCTPQNLVTMLVSRPAVLDDRAVRRTLLRLQQSMAAATRAPTGSGVARLPGRRPSIASVGRVRKGALRLISGLTLISAGLAGLLVFVGHSGGIAKALAPSSSSSPSLQHHSRALGASQMIPPATNRPPLRVRASRVGTVHRVGTSPYLFDGNRFFGVRFTMINRGKQVWVSQPGTTYEVAGDSVGPRRGGSAIRIQEGRVLPDPIHLPPGHRVTGYVVFQVPIGEPMTSLSLTVGPGKPQTVDWSIDHQ